MKLKEVIRILEDEEKSRKFKESSSSSSSSIEEVIEGSTSNASFERTITLNEGSSKELTFERISGVNIREFLESHHIKHLLKKRNQLEKPQETHAKMISRIYLIARMNILMKYPLEEIQRKRANKNMFTSKPQKKTITLR